MLLEIPVRLGRYAPGKLVSPRAEAVSWILEHQDGQGSVTASLECPEAVELRFHKPPGGGSFHITVRGQLSGGGEGPEWAIIVPSDRMGILFIPQGFTAEQSLMGAVYRLPRPHRLRILADQVLKMPGINFTVQVLESH